MQEVKALTKFTWRPARPHFPQGGRGSERDSDSLAVARVVPGHPLCAGRRVRRVPSPEPPAQPCGWLRLWVGRPGGGDRTAHGPGTRSRDHVGVGIQACQKPPSTRVPPAAVTPLVTAPCSSSTRSPEPRLSGGRRWAGEPQPRRPPLQPERRRWLLCAAEPVLFHAVLMLVLPALWGLSG